MIGRCQNRHVDRVTIPYVNGGFASREWAGRGFAIRSDLGPGYEKLASKYTELGFRRKITRYQKYVRSKLVKSN